MISDPNSCSMAWAGSGVKGGVKFKFGGVKFKLGGVKHVKHVEHVEHVEHVNLT